MTTRPGPDASTSATKPNYKEWLMNCKNGNAPNLIKVELLKQDKFEEVEDDEKSMKTL